MHRLMTNEANNERVAKLMRMIEILEARIREMCELVEKAQRIIRKNLRPWQTWGSKVLLYLETAIIKSGEK